MSDLTILSEFPIILTKDPSWKPRTQAKEGAIILLPKDAVLVIPKPKATLSNLEGDLGSSHMQGTPKAQGHEADNLNAESAGE